MALQPYSDPGQALAIYQAEQIPPEELERRQKEAEELDKKLRHIVEDLPDRAYKVAGSNAGASSASFHDYRHARRREQERLKQIDEHATKEEQERERQEKLARLEQEEEEKTAKRRAKRQKRKMKQKSNKKQKVDLPSGGGGIEESDGDDKEDEEEQNKGAVVIESTDLD